MYDLGPEKKKCFKYKIYTASVFTIFESFKRFKKM